MSARKQGSRRKPSAATQEVEESLERLNAECFGMMMRLAYLRRGYQRHARDMLKRITTHIKGWRQHLPRLIGMAAIGFVVGWGTNVAVMAIKYDGYNVPRGAAVVGRGNMILGTLVWFVGSFLVMQVIGYRLRAGKEGFRKSVRSLPQNVSAFFETDSAAPAHLLWGFGFSLILVLLIGPALTGIVAIGAAVWLGSVLRPLVMGGVHFFFRTVARKIVPSMATPPPSAVAVTAIGAALAALAGYIVVSQRLRLLMALAAIVAALILSRVRSPKAVPAALLLGVGVVVVLWAGADPARADDGGYPECGGNWPGGCAGADTLIGIAAIGGAAAGAGGAAGGLVGEGTGEEEMWPPGSSEGPCGEPDEASADPEEVDMVQKIADNRAEFYRLLDQLDKGSALLAKHDETMAMYQKKIDVARKIIANQEESFARLAEGPGAKFRAEYWDELYKDLASSGMAKQIGWNLLHLPKGAVVGAADTLKFFASLPGMTVTAADFYMHSSWDETVSAYGQFGAGMKEGLQNWLGDLTKAVESNDRQKAGDLMGTPLGAVWGGEVVPIGVAAAVQKAAKFLPPPTPKEMLKGPGRPIQSNSDAAAMGATLEELQGAQKVVSNNPNVEALSFRPGGSARVDLLGKSPGGVAQKPEGLYPTSMNEIDVRHLGYGDPSLPNGGVGAMKFKVPDPPPSHRPGGMSQQQYDEILARYKQNMKEYIDNKPKMDKAKDDGYHFREDGKQVTYKIDSDPKTGIVSRGDRLRVYEDALGQTKSVWEKAANQMVIADLDPLYLKFFDSFLSTVKTMNAAKPGSGTKMLLAETSKFYKELNKAIGTKHAGTGNLDPTSWLFPKGKTGEFLKGQIKRVQDEFLGPNATSNSINVSRESICSGRPGQAAAKKSVGQKAAAVAKKGAAGAKAGASTGGKGQAATDKAKGPAKPAAKPGAPKASAPKSAPPKSK